MWQEYKEMHSSNKCPIQDSAYLWGTGERNMIGVGYPGDFVFIIFYSLSWAMGTRDGLIILYIFFCPA